MSKGSYIIAGGKSGSDRLLILANATWRTSASFLRESGLKPEMRVLDIGCGNGEIARRYGFEIMKENGEIVGIDRDDTAVEVAEERLKGSPLKAVFRKADLEKDDLSELGRFDAIYARFILSHLADPMGFLQKLKGSLAENGKLIIEDVDFDGHVSHPQNDFYDRFVELYKAFGKVRGGNPLLGRELLLLVKEAGFNPFHSSCVCPPYTSGDGKQMALVTFDLIRAGLVQRDLLSKEESDTIYNGLKTFTDRSDSMMTLPRIFQVAASVKGNL